MKCVSSPRPPRARTRCRSSPCPPTGSSRVAVVLLSGDGGWRDIDRTIAEELNKQGLSVSRLGQPALFLDPQDTRRDGPPDLAAGDRGLSRQNGATKEIALIGFSFGADVLPFLYPKLASLSLIATGRDDFRRPPEPKADWEIRVVG